MFRVILLVNLLLCPLVLPKRRHRYSDKSASDELGGKLVSALRNDVNLDLSMDEEYEDLRAELLAYHTALASLTSNRASLDELVDDEDENEGVTAPPKEIQDAVAAASAAAGVASRRSMKSTPCWKLGGICINYKMCEGHRFLTEVPGCKDKLEVCCFTWNNFQAKDRTDQGLSNPAYPWSKHQEFGGRGIIGPNDKAVESRIETTPKDATVEELKFDLSSEEVSKKKQNKPGKKHRKSSKLKAPIVVIVKSDKK